MNINEVSMIRRIFTLLLSAVLMLGVLLPPVNVQAATMDSTAGIVETSGGRLNVRAAASTGSSVVTTLPDGSYVTLISKSGSWWRVEYANGKYGYCHSNYIKTVGGSAAIVSTQSTVLNVRSGPGTSYSKVGTLAKGQTVVVLSSSNGWSRVLYSGTKTGYVSSQYLTGGQSKVSLAVPSFKQTDSRWASVKIGSSGKTIAQIGCATTAIAMMESYRTGATVYPDSMSKKLSYSASGNVYWPSHYTAVANSSGYLTGIYNLLKQGKPVLFGAKNTSGGQHWVVITGYTGGSTLTASGFTVNDPGSSSRTNLQQFLNAYPNFYKYFYY